MTPDELHTLVVNAANNALEQSSSDELFKLTKYAVTLFSEQIWPHLRVGEDPRLLLPVLLKEDKDPSGALLLLEDRAILTWMRGTLRAQYFAVTLPYADVRDSQLLVVESSGFKAGHKDLHVGMADGTRYALVFQKWYAGTTLPEQAAAALQGPALPVADPRNVPDITPVIVPPSPPLGAPVIAAVVFPPRDIEPATTSVPVPSDLSAGPATPPWPDPPAPPEPPWPATAPPPPPPPWPAPPAAAGPPWPAPPKPERTALIVSLVVVAVLAVGGIGTAVALTGDSSPSTSSAPLLGGGDGQVAEGPLALTTEGVGSIRFGADVETALSELTKRLGTPDEAPDAAACDSNPDTVSRYVTWGNLSVEFTNYSSLSQRTVPGGALKLEGWTLFAGRGTPLSVDPPYGLQLGASADDVMSATGGTLGPSLDGNHNLISTGDQLWYYFDESNLSSGVQNISAGSGGCGE